MLGGQLIIILLVFWGRMMTSFAMFEKGCAAVLSKVCFEVVSVIKSSFRLTS